MAEQHREPFETVTASAVTPPFFVDPGADTMLRAEAARFRRALSDSRSAVFLRLFDYLLDRCFDARAPKEIEIAVAIFGKEATYDTGQDSIVRVHVHRLRRRLHDFYANRSGPKLLIPNGEYRIVLALDDSDPEAGARPGGVPPSMVRRFDRYRRPLLALCLLLIVLPWALVLIRQDWSPPSTLSGTAFWRPLANSRSAVLLVAGDYFSIAESRNEKDVHRLIMHPGIRSRKELDGYFVQHPEAFYRFYDMDIYTTPTATVSALWSLLPLVARLPGHERDNPALIASSRLSEQQLRTHDVIYVGDLAALRPLFEPLFYVSGFSAAQFGNALADKASSRTFVATAGPAAVPDAEGNPRYGTDYGYLASFPGPFGHRILIIAGFSDASVTRMADLVAEPRRLDEVSRRCACSAAFEALYQVKTVGNLAVDTSLLIARPLRSGDTAGANTVRREGSAVRSN